MNRKHTRFHKNVDVELYRIKFPPDSSIQEHELKAISSAWNLMGNFTHIENGLARTIIVGTGLNKKENWKEYLYKIGKCFSFSQQISMVEDLVKRDCFTLSDNSNSNLPTVFSKAELPYFQACRLAMEFRNELAHNGVIFWVHQEGDSFRHFPLIGANNPRVSNPNDIFITVDISAPSTISRDGKQTSLGFSDWVFRIAGRLPIYNTEPIVSPTGITVDPKEFLSDHKVKVIKSIESTIKSSSKKIDKLISSIH